MNRRRQSADLKPRGPAESKKRRPLDPAFGARLGLARRQAGLTQRELAGRAGVRLNSIWRYEQGRHPENYDVLGRLAEAIEVSFEFLLHGGGPSAHAAGVAEERGTWNAALRSLLASTGLSLAPRGTAKRQLQRAWPTLAEERKEEVRKLVRDMGAIAAFVDRVFPEASARALKRQLSTELSATIADRILVRSRSAG